MAADDHRVGPTRVRDLLAVGAVAVVVAYLVIRLHYSSIPQLPRLAGASAALIGIGEAILGWSLRSRIRRRAAYLRATQREDRTGPIPPPVPALFAARILALAKASALAAAVFLGLWVGVAAYVLPEAGSVTAAAADSATAGIGLAGAAVFLAGALFLESCCRAPDDEPPDMSNGSGTPA